MKWRHCFTKYMAENLRGHDAELYADFVRISMIIKHVLMLPLLLVEESYHT